MHAHHRPTNGEDPGRVRPHRCPVEHAGAKRAPGGEVSCAASLYGMESELRRTRPEVIRRTKDEDEEAGRDEEPAPDDGGEVRRNHVGLPGVARLAEQDAERKHAVHPPSPPC
jgi:hypothetical protein